jgi:hypothetical protein
MSALYNKIRCCFIITPGLKTPQLGFQSGTLYLAEKAKKRYLVLLLAFRADEGSRLRAVASYYPVNILYALAA